MVSNIVVFGKNIIKVNHAAQMLADTLGMFFLDFNELVLYEGNRKTEAELKEENLFEKFLFKAAAEAVEYENSVLAISGFSLSPDVISRLKQTSLCIWLTTKSRATKAETIALNAVFASLSDIKIDIKASDTTKIINKITAAVSDYYGG